MTDKPRWVPVENPDGSWTVGVAMRPTGRVTLLPDKATAQEIADVLNGTEREIRALRSMSGAERSDWEREGWKGSVLEAMP